MGCGHQQTAGQRAWPSQAQDPESCLCWPSLSFILGLLWSQQPARAPEHPKNVLQGWMLGALPASPGPGSQSLGTLAFRPCHFSSGYQGWEAGAGWLRTWEWVVSLSLAPSPLGNIPPPPNHCGTSGRLCNPPRRNGVMREATGEGGISGRAGVACAGVLAGLLSCPGMSSVTSIFLESGRERELKVLSR